MARLAGDEFVVLLEGLHAPEQAQRIADAVQAAREPGFDLGSVQVAVSASIGVALAPPDERDADAFLRRADMALYAAKAAGRNRVRIAS